MVCRELVACYTFPGVNRLLYVLLCSICSHEQSYVVHYSQFVYGCEVSKSKRVYFRLGARFLALVVTGYPRGCSG